MILGGRAFLSRSGATTYASFSGLEILVGINFIGTFLHAEVLTAHRSVGFSSFWITGFEETA